MYTVALAMSTILYGSSRSLRASPPALIGVALLAFKADITPAIGTHLKVLLPFVYTDMYISFVSRNISTL